MEKNRRRRLMAIAGAIIIVIIIAVTVTVVLVTKGDDDDLIVVPPSTTIQPEVTTSDSDLTTTTIAPDPIDPPGPSWSDFAHYDNAAISCDAPCSGIGRDILQNKNGNVADAAIAVLLCMGVIHAQSLGIGGGFLMVYYNASTGESQILNAREVAPLAATEEMFNGNSSLSQKGGLAVAVPGEIKGYWELYNKLGSKNVPWADLFAPTIKICQDGFLVDNHTAKALQGQRDNILREPSMVDIFVDPVTKDIKKLGDIIKRPVLAETLKIIAQFGGNALYDPKIHDLSKWLVEDLRDDFNGIITQEDLLKYSVIWDEPLIMDIQGGFKLHTIPLPGSGPVSAFILNILSRYNLNQGPFDTPEDELRTYHLITEAFKHAYAQRTKLGDPQDPDVTDFVNELVYNMTQSEEFIDEIVKLIKEDETNNTVEYYGAEYYTPDDHGTSHVSIVGPNGDSIAITSTVNLYFGAGIRSRRTGIIYNDEMDDFSAPGITNGFNVPPSVNNFIRPGKRPLSSMSPSIYVDDQGDVRLSVGTAGGTMITTTTTYVAIRNLWFNETIKESIDARRIHHQLFPMELQYEYGLPAHLVQGLDGFGHNMTRFTPGSSVCSGVSRYGNGTLAANWDFRKPGSIDGF